VVHFGALVGGYVAGFVHALANSLTIFCFFIKHEKKKREKNIMEFRIHFYLK
jgi:hypothetical protein